ncbi:MAG: hypothetical protein KAS49_04140, partial [Candidatus Cloacimonetes bacterium]|nr:hypothetical protein [Candidatus Cloacimonadota bacterium]
DEVDFSAEASYRADGKIVYQNWFDLILGGGFGDSYQLPSFYDLHWKDGSQAIGDPNLLPENSRGWNLYYKFKIAKSFFKVSCNFNEVNNLIHWYRSRYHWKPGNIGKVEISNYEIQSEIEMFDWILASFSWQRTFAYDKSFTDDGLKSDHYGNNITYTPRSQTEVALIATINNFEFNINYSRTGKQWSTKDNLRAPMDAYQLVGSKISYRYEKEKWLMTVFGGGNNILNEEYEVTSKTPKPGENWFSGVDLELKF